MGAAYFKFDKSGKDQKNYPLNPLYAECTGTTANTATACTTSVNIGAKACCMHTEFITAGSSTAAKLEAY